MFSGLELGLVVVVSSSSLLITVIPHGSVLSIGASLMK